MSDSITANPASSPPASSDGRLVVMVWTQRGEMRHVISMRHCHAKEKEIWRRRMG
jgi:uncharacterized DUF497 family protein